MNGQPSASWLELNGNVKLATDPFLSVCRGPCLTGEPKQNNAQPVTVNTTLFPFHVNPLCLAVCGKRKRCTIEKERQWIEGEVHCAEFAMDLQQDIF